MYHQTLLTLMIAFATCLLLQLCVSASDNDLVDFIFSRIPELQGQAAAGGRHQFAALIFLDQTDVDNLDKFQYHPQHKDGTPWVDNSTPFSPSNPWNYIVARPERPQHAEEIILDNLYNMWNNYNNQGAHGPPVQIVIFTRLYPCTGGTPGQTHKCAEQIRAVLNEAPYNTVPSRILAYNFDDYSPVTDQNKQDIEFMRANIMIHSLPMEDCFNYPMLRTNEVASTSDTCTEPSVIQTLQGCVLQCLGNDIYPCVEDSEVDGQKAYLMNILVDKCLLNEQRELCLKDTYLEETGAACALLQKQSVVEKLVKCYDTCSLKPISKPCQNTRDFNYQISLLSSSEERKNYQPPSAFGCKDRRRTGLLCTYIDNMYLTAGNSLCRDDHPCGYHGYSYTWCYTSINNNWDYCCSDTCEYHDYDYLWCYAGSEWQYCGKGGTVPIGSRTSETPHPCLADNPCGLHYDVSTNNKYFWCYVDTDLAWDYCCSPKPKDNECTYNQGTSYKWCKTSYTYETVEWQYCYY